MNVDGTILITVGVVRVNMSFTGEASPRYEIEYV